MAEDIREVKARRRRAEGDRVRAVRELLGEKQPAFAQRLTAAARQLGMPWLSYDNTIVSKLELGTRDLSIDDAVVVAAVDPQRRGKLWVAWNEDGAELLDPAKDRKASDEELDRATQAAERERREEASRKRRQIGKRRRGGP